MKFYQPLALPFECFNQARILKIVEDYDPAKFYIWKIDVSEFSEQFHNLANSLGCNIFYAELFHTPAGRNLVWHIDTEEPSDIMRLNFVWGSNKHMMQWGETVKKSYSPNVFPTVTGTKSINFKEHEIKTTESYCITAPTIVHVGVPHRVVNYDNSSRFCLSVNLHKGDEKLMFEDAKSLFSEYRLD